MKTWEIYRYIYEDVCGDSYYGKQSKHKSIGFVTDTEDNIKVLVNKLNERNHSYYAKSEPEDEWDDDYVDEDYISYREIKIETLEQIESRYRR